jgi:hypothetical protein
MPVLAITILAILALMALKTLRNVIAPPFVIVPDSSSEYFDIPTMYKKSVSANSLPLSAVDFDIVEEVRERECKLVNRLCTSLRPQ